MATGERLSVQLLTAATATNGVPTAATAGQDCNDLKYPESAVLSVKSTAGSATMTVDIRLWGYEASSAEWFLLGTGANAGKINAGQQLTELTANQISHSEILSGMRGLDRVYAEITAIAGTSTAISAWLVARV